MITYEEFCNWLDGFLTNRSWTDIQQIDIETIQEKMKQVKEEPEFDLDKFKHLGTKRNSVLQPVVIPSIKQDDQK
jgi:esterase/lipase